MKKILNFFGVTFGKFFENETLRTRLLWTFFAVASAILIFFGLQLTEGQFDSGPCTPNGFPGRCYRIRPEMCETVWTQSKSSCMAIIAGITLPPGRLVGPALRKCQMVKLDRSFSYNRISTAECDELHRDLETWLQGNSYFR